MNLNKIYINNVNNRFLPISESVLKGYESEPKITDFEYIKELGTGSFGRVFLVYHKKTKVKYAIKAINKKDESNIEEKPYFCREIEIMYRIHHPNIVKLYGHFEDSDYCYFIMEYIPNGNAYSLIPKNGKKKQTNQIIASIIKDVISAVYFLHNMNPPIIHRDIKPENVLMNENNVAILTDFGWSNYLTNNEQRKTVCGTPIYLAPEMINKKGHDGHIDIWCIGVLLFELITGRVPFQGNDIDTLKYNIRNMNIAWPSDINNEAKDLISKILKYNPEERLTIEEILNHIFIKKYYPNAINNLILPNFNIKYKIFLVSVDNPKNWDPILPEEDSNYFYQTTINNKKRIKRINSNKGYFKAKIELTKHKCMKKNIINNNEFNYNTINEYKNFKRDKYIPYKYYSKNENNKSYDNYDRNENYEIFNDYKYIELLKKYNNLRDKYYLLKNGVSIELEELTKELNEKENKISQLMKERKQYEFSEKEYRKKKRELKELEMIYEDLKIENNELKERINYYSKYIKENDIVFFDNNLNEIRDSMKGENKTNFTKAMDKLKYDLDEQTQKYFDTIIKEKEKELEKYKEDGKLRRVREKQKFSVLLNKYDKALSKHEKENKQLKSKLKELEKKFV